MMHAENQLTFFSDEDIALKNSSKCNKSDAVAIKIYIDGAARNNPGPAGVGIYLKRGDKVLLEQGFFLGEKTNNQAEYLALVISLIFVEQYAKKEDQILIHSDSQLLVRQMTGIYAVRDEMLKKIKAVAIKLLQNYKATFCHVYRKDNIEADALANRGIDKKVSLPKKIEDILRAYQII